MTEHVVSLSSTDRAAIKVLQKYTEDLLEALRLLKIAVEKLEQRS